MGLYIDPKWIYLADVCGGLKVACMILFVLALCLVFSSVWTIHDLKYFEQSEKIHKAIRNFVIVCSFSLLFLLGVIVIPSKTTVQEMMIASYVTEDATQTQDGKELIDYLFDKVEGKTK